MKTRWIQRVFLSLLLLCAATNVRAEPTDPPEFRSAYSVPVEQRPLPREVYWQYIDVGVLAGMLVLAAVAVHRWRRREAVFIIAAAGIAYFGFYRQGCVCAVGSIQNVSATLFNLHTPLPWAVATFFALPLVAAIVAGRVFCSGVCPLGAVQDVMLWKPVHVPTWVESAVGMAAHLYLGLAVMLAATGSDFLICSWDPFVGMFRMSGTVGMLLLGAGFLLTSMFIGRAYCRFLCPYSVLLRALSRVARWKVHISPQECVDCRLCEKACPLGALQRPAREEAAEVNPRRQALVAVGVTIVLLVALPLLGWHSRSLMARMDRTVQLSLRIAAEESTRNYWPTDESTAWRKTGETAVSLYQRAADIERRLGVGGAILGVWMALVASVRVVRASLPTRRAIYDADPAGCLACARCFDSCPVELERRGVPITIEGRSVPELAGVSA